MFSAQFDITPMCHPHDGCVWEPEAWEKRLEIWSAKAMCSIGPGDLLYLLSIS